jgi:hypothetical protein
MADDTERERERDGVRVAWLRLLQAYVRAARKHIEAAEVHARAGHPERADAALGRARAERKGYERALAMHPEWGDQAPELPELDAGSGSQSEPGGGRTA